MLKIICWTFPSSNPNQKCFEARDAVFVRSAGAEMWSKRRYIIIYEGKILVNCNWWCCWSVWGALKVRFLVRTCSFHSILSRARVLCLLWRRVYEASSLREGVIFDVAGFVKRSCVDIFVCLDCKNGWMDGWRRGYKALIINMTTKRRSCGFCKCRNARSWTVVMSS